MGKKLTFYLKFGYTAKKDFIIFFMFLETHNYISYKNNILSIKKIIFHTLILNSNENLRKNGIKIT